MISTIEELRKAKAIVEECKKELDDKNVRYNTNIKVGMMIDKAIATGATNVDNLSFSLSNYESQCNDLITIATKKAKTRADVIASALASSVDGLSSISTSCSTNNYNPPRLYMAKNMIFAMYPAAVIWVMAPCSCTITAKSKPFLPTTPSVIRHRIWV